MPIKYHYDIEQGTVEWHKLRTGMLTASNLKLVLTPTLKLAKNDKVKMLTYEIAAQRLTNYMEPQWEGEAMMRGHMEEIYAKEMYAESHTETHDCGFITNDEMGFDLGFSPDGVIGNRGLEHSGVEVKSRIQKYQIQTIASNEMPDEFMLQIQGGLLVTKWNYIDFISYSNGLPMFVKRILPDKEIQDAITEAAKSFEKNVQTIIAQYKENSKKFVCAERRDFNMEGDIK